MRDKIVGLPNVEKDEMRSALDGMRRMMPEFIEMQLMLAAMRRRVYLEYVELGFSAEQALELTKTHHWG